MIFDLGLESPTPPKSSVRLLYEARAFPSFTRDGRFMAYEVDMDLIVKDLATNRWGVVDLRPYCTLSKVSTIIVLFKFILY